MKSIKSLQGTYIRTVRNNKPRLGGVYCFTTPLLDRYLPGMKEYDYPMIKKFFTSVDDKLTTVEDYIDLRVRSGKFTQDIPIISRLISENTKERSVHLWTLFYKARITQKILNNLHKTYQAALNIPFLENIITVFLDGFRVLSWGIIELCVLLTASFYSIFFLIRLFQNTPLSFFIALPVVLLINLYMIGVFYLYVDKKLKRESVNWLTAIKNVSTSFYSTALLFSYHIAVILGGTILFFIVSLYYSYFFDFLSIPWGESFWYWLVVIFLAITIFILLFLASFLFSQAYNFMLLDKKTAFQAFSLSLKLYKTFSLPITLFNLGNLTITVIFAYFAISHYYYLGIGLWTMFSIHTYLYLNYLLRRKFIERTTPFVEERISKYSFFLTFIPITGVATYILSSLFILQHYKDIDGLFIEKRATQLQTYEDKNYGFSIGYPKEWTKYQTKENLITFYNNDTETKTGGIWVTVTVSPVSTDFDTLFKSKPGLVFYETVTNNVTTKVTNLAVEGHSTVEYLFVKNDETYTEYQTHYLIRNGTKEYNVAFITLSKNVENLNAELFKEILASFHFLEK